MLRKQHHSESAADRASREVVMEFSTNSASGSVVSNHASPDRPQSASVLLRLALVDVGYSLSQVVRHIFAIIETFDLH